MRGYGISIIRFMWSLQLYANDQRFKALDTDLGTRGKLLKKSLSSSLLCFFQSKDLMDAIATTLITRKRQTESLKFTHVVERSDLSSMGIWPLHPPSRKSAKQRSPPEQFQSLLVSLGSKVSIWCSAIKQAQLFDDHYHTGHQKWTPHPHCPQLLVPSGKVNSYPALENINDEIICSLLTGGGGNLESQLPTPGGVVNVERKLLYARVSSIDNYDVGT